MSDIVLKSGPSLMAVVKYALSGVGNLFATIAAASAVATAVENNRKPKARDLKVLGLEQAQFSRYY